MTPLIPLVPRSEGGLGKRRWAFTRCNNVLWISGANKSEGDRADVKMEG